MTFDDVARLLDPAPMPLETGYERLTNGVLHIAIRTDMRGCTGEMFEWWFGQRVGAREYRWWHPLDHISSDWAGGTAGTPVGATHLVEERFTDMPAETLSIEFRDPAEAFDPVSLRAARDARAVSALLLAHGGPGHDARRTAAGAVIGTRLIHVGRDTTWGMALRSHFFMGHDLAGLGMPPAAIADQLPDRLGAGMLQHCYDEFSFLARILPAVFEAEGGTTPARPW